MSALTQARNTLTRGDTVYHFEVKGGVQIFAGSLVALEAGFAVPGRTNGSLVAAGRAEEQVDASGAASGDFLIRVTSGVFQWGNSSGADKVNRAHIGSPAYIVDDQTVARRADGGRSAAGVIVGVDAQGVWVRTGF